MPSPRFLIHILTFSPERVSPVTPQWSYPRKELKSQLLPLYSILFSIPGLRVQEANFHLPCLHHQTPSLYRSCPAFSLAPSPFHSRSLSQKKILSPFLCLVSLHVVLHVVLQVVLQGLVSLLDLVWKCSLPLSQCQDSQRKICPPFFVQIASEDQKYPKEKFCS